MNSGDYCEMLEEYLLPYGKRMGGKIDSNRTKEWLKSKNINTLNLPAISPDLNPLRMSWAKKQESCLPMASQYFRTVNELQESRIGEWDNLSTGELKKLIDSMSKRCLEIVYNY